MGREFGLFTLSPELDRCAERAHRLRNEAIADALAQMTQAVQALGRAVPIFGRRRGAEPHRSASA